MKSSEIKEKFILLRGEGRSFASIAEELNVCKLTLIKWSKEFQLDIENLKATRMESLRELYITSKEEKVKLYKMLSNKVLKEIEKKEFKDETFDHLMRLYSEYEKYIEKELEIELKEVVEPVLKGFEESIDTWKVY